MGETVEVDGLARAWLAAAAAAALAFTALLLLIVASPLYVFSGVTVSGWAGIASYRLVDAGGPALVPVLDSLSTIARLVAGVALASAAMLLPLLPRLWAPAVPRRLLLLAAVGHMLSASATALAYSVLRVFHSDIIPSLLHAIALASTSQTMYSTLNLHPVTVNPTGAGLASLRLAQYAPALAVAQLAAAMTIAYLLHRHQGGTQKNQATTSTGEGGGA